MDLIDILVFTGYIIVLFGIGLWAGRKKDEHSAEDFFLTKNTLPWYVIGFSIIAAGISSEQLLGTVGYAYKYGLSVANWEWLNGPAILLMIFIFVPFYIRKKIVTMPEFLEKRFDKRVRIIFAIITLLTYVFINLAGVIFSGGFALHSIFGINLYLGMWGMVVVAMILIVYGGMESVAWTNVFQAALLLISGLLIFIIGMNHLPGGWYDIISTGDRSHLILPADHPDIPGTGLIVLALSTNVWFFCTNQTINQSALGAKSEWHALIGVLLAGFLTILIVLVDVFPGLIAYAINPHLPTADEAYPYLIHTMIPSGFKGIIFAALCGAIISTIEALGNASATIFSFDIYKQYINKDGGAKEMIRYGRITGAVVLIVGGIWAPMVMQFGHIFSYFQECWAFIAIPVTIIFLLGILWKRMPPSAAFYTLLLAFPYILLPFLLRLFKVTTNVFNVAGFVFLFTLLFTISFTLLSKKEKGADETLTWKPSMLKIPMGSGKWYKKYWYVFVLVYVLIYLVIYGLYW